MKEFWLCFVPLFVAVDAVGVLPMFLSLTTGVSRERLPHVLLQSVATAAVVALAFIALGKPLLGFLGMEVYDFMIAGGILLLAISLTDLITGDKRRKRMDPNTLGAVPIGVPLITGPAVLTTCLLLVSSHGRPLTAVAVLANIALAGVIFMFARPITRVLGNAGSKTASKIASLLLASFAVMLVRKGVATAVTTMLK